ncbi:MAG: VTT domain-containing protein, partial [Anaerovoracaceae bacterium]
MRHGNSTVFFCRFVPIVRSLISIPAGMARMGLKQFFFYTTMGTLVWNSVLVLLGAFTGENWEAIIKYIGIYSKVILVVLILAAIALLIYLIR